MAFQTLGSVNWGQLAGGFTLQDEQYHNCEGFSQTEIGERAQLLAIFEPTSVTRFWLLRLVLLGSLQSL